jgi:hypothetical protein
VRISNPKKRLEGFMSNESDIFFCDEGVKLTTHLHLIQGQEERSYTSISPYVFVTYCISNEAQGQIYLTRLASQESREAEFRSRAVPRSSESQSSVSEILCVSIFRECIR